MKALIHIGLPKVGSSSIQHFLHINAEALTHRGIRYARLNPRFGSQYELAVTGLALAGDAVTSAPERLVLGLRNPGDEAAYAEDFRQFLDSRQPGWSEPLYVGSSEHIQPWLSNPRRIRALDSFLDARFSEVRYLLYLRPQGDLLLSSYAEMVRRGSTSTFEQYFANRQAALNLNAVVTLWEGAVGADRLDVRLLRPDALVAGDLIADFCAAMGTEPEGLTKPPRMNTAPGARELAFRRRLNTVVSVRRADASRNPWHLRAVRVWAALQRQPDPPLTLAPAMRAQIESQYARSNERLRARRFPDRASLF